MWREGGGGGIFGARITEVQGERERERESTFVVSECRGRRRVEKEESGQGGKAKRGIGARTSNSSRKESVASKQREAMI
jgi:hypothetical protein